MSTGWDSGLGKTIVVDGVEQPTRGTLALVAGVGVDLAVADSENADATTVTISATGGGGVAGEDWFPSAKAATAAALPAYTRTIDTIDANANGAFPAIDGVTVGVGQDFVLQHGADNADNGIWTLVSAGSGGSAWSSSRRADWQSESTVTSQARVPIEQGTEYGGRVLRLAVNDPFVVNVTGAVFSLDTGLGAGASTQVLAWDGSQWAGTMTPSLTSLSLATALTMSAGAYAAFGAAPADAGDIRVSHAFTMQGESNTPGTDRKILTWGDVAADTVGLGDAAVVTRVTGSRVDVYAGAVNVAQLGAAAGDFIAFGADPAEAGAIRLSHAMGVYGESSAPGTDRQVVSWGVVAADVVGLGDANVVTRVTGSTVDVYAGATYALSLTSTAIAPQLNVTWPIAFSGPTISHAQRTTDAATTDMTIAAQGAWASATGANRKGGDLLLKAGITTSGGSVSKVRFYAGATSGTLTEFFNFYYDSATSLSVMTTVGGNLMLMPPSTSSTYIRSGSAAGDLVCDVMTTSGTYYVRTNSGTDICITAINKNVSLFAVGSYGSGSKVLFGGKVTTIPTTSPVDGGLLYWDSSGNLWAVNTAGVHTQLTT